MTTSSAKPSRRPRLQRLAASSLPGFRLMARDCEIIQAVYTYRALTTAQIEALFFETKQALGQRTAKLNSRCQYRLQLLYQYGYLFRDEQAQKPSEGRRPLVYWLDTKGAQLLIEELGYDPDELAWDKPQAVSQLFLDHLLATNQMRIAVTLAVQQHGFTLEQWIDDKALKSPQMKDTVTLTGPQGGTQKAAVVPDGYFLLDAGGHRYHHFLEIDRATVTGEAALWSRRDWGRKVTTYLEYIRSGKYEARYHTQGLRILAVTTSEKRLAHLKAITEKAGGKSRFWFTTFSEATPERVLTEAIWQVASREGRYSLIW